MKEFVRGMIMLESQNFFRIKDWMQSLFPEEYFMDCDEGCYFEIPTDMNLFPTAKAFAVYLNEKLNEDLMSVLKADFYLCLITHNSNCYFFETYFHCDFDEYTTDYSKISYSDEEILDTVRKWLKWDKLHKEYLKYLDRKNPVL